MAFDICYDCRWLGDNSCGNDQDCECYEPVGGMDCDDFDEYDGYELEGREEIGY